MRDYDGKTGAERVAGRRARLVDAGIELFGEHGYAGTSIRAVLRQAGLRDRYFGESFADLDALLAAAYDQLIDEEVSECRVAIDATIGASEGARAMIDAISRGLQGNPGHARIKLREVFSGGPMVQVQRREGLRKLAQLVADLLPAADGVDDRERLLLGVGVVAAADAYLLAWLDGELGMSREGVVDLVAQVFDSIAGRFASRQ
ncbi:TetR/AcrR family transcriptional regulator [Mycobacterium montefiorense]|uniref:TetR-family transcriptional regulator n=1 Tax=Mycobacterium montefiorense TaxID=154654 RepID=A0AA37USQ7_9MYCO|nr:TetR family transcriptional regulator [Mycobacterium montefiorense]GBG37400.1 putative TetR-family transcriptional regulator [Mycobacterium montefiorense]GKU36653.1 putative TetR-family transcriptional regulator [Mycobacterium montefiorense]GKU42162.1 putative TetR-family transcriptional regulator [Mycobacterium montefiorense]GKU45911.1 putative TetR-family transcriptional regulator [Mycobacterium montefiorense]GKU52897.1 putative TetR-family transcriptional regulator [Mycobacterium montefi